MKEEAPTILPAIGFSIMAILAGRVIIKYNIALSRANAGVKAAYETADSEKIKDAEEELSERRSKQNSTIIKGIKILLWGSLGTILLSILEAEIRHFL
jgi:hypothetical protein